MLRKIAIISNIIFIGYLIFAGFHLLSIFAELDMWEYINWRGLLPSAALLSFPIINIFALLKKT